MENCAVQWEWNAAYISFLYDSNEPDKETGD